MIGLGASSLILGVEDDFGLLPLSLGAFPWPLADLRSFQALYTP